VRRAQDPGARAAAAGWRQTAKLSFLQRRECLAERHEVVLYTRKECHLCEVVKESLERLRERAEFCLRVVDIDADEETRRLYNEEVPVVFINGRKAFKYRMDEQEFLRKLGR
jgi:glutaredoxin